MVAWDQGIQNAQSHFDTINKLHKKRKTAQEVRDAAFSQIGLNAHVCLCARALVRACECTGVSKAFLLSVHPLILITS